MAVTEDRILEDRVTERRHDPDAERAWMRRLPIAWVAGVGSLMLFEPTPTNPNAHEPAWAVVAFFAFLSALALMTIGFARKARWVFGVSGAAGVLGMMLSYACMDSGHHLGAWWLIELGTFAALTTLSIPGARFGDRRSP